MDVCLGHAVVVQVRFFELLGVSGLPFILLPSCQWDIIAISVFLEERRVFDGDRYSLHVEDGIGYFGAVCGVQVIRHAFKGSLELGCIVRSSIVKNDMMGEVFVTSGVFGVRSVIMCASSAGIIIPAVATAPSTPSSSVVSSVSPLRGRVGWVGFFFDVVSHVDLLARRDVAHTNGRLFSNDEIQ